MKLVLEQVRCSLYNNQERIDFFQSNQDPSLSIESLQSVLENRFLSNRYFCSSLSKRISTYSLSNHPIMTLTDFSEEQTDSIDYDNTYFYSEETSRGDDSSSLTTITSNLTQEVNPMENDISIYSDTDDISEENNHINIDSNDRNSNNDEEILISSNCNLIGLIPIKDSRIDQQTFSDYHSVKHSSEQNNTIRSSVDIGSLNLPMTLSIPLSEKQSDQQKQKRTNQDDDDDDEYYIIVPQQKSIDQLTMITNENEFDDDDDEYIESTRLFDNGQHDGNLSDESQYSDDLRYSSHPIQNSGVNDDLSHTNSTLRQKVISITKVRCKQRQTWINSSINLHKPFISTNQIDGTNASSSSSPLKANMNSTIPPMLLPKNSLDCNENENNHNETPSYDFLQLNSDHSRIEFDESIVSPLFKTNNTHDKDASSTSKKKTNNFYLIHHQSSLVPIKNLLNQTLHSNIELIQMDEQHSMLQIIDGVVTIVPKDQSALTNSDDEKSEEQQNNSHDYETSQNYDSPEREKRSSSSASSVSTPSISEHEPEPEPEESSSSSSSSSSRSSSNKEQVQEPFVLLRDIPSKSSPPPSQTDQSVDLLDLFSTPPVPSSSNSNNNDKNTKNLLDDSLSSVSSYEHHHSHSESSKKEKQIRSSSPIPTQSKLSSPSLSLKDDLPANKKSILNEEIEVDYPIPKSEPPPAAKPINKARINEFASLLSSAVHLIPPQLNKQPEIPKTTSAPSPSRSEDQSYSSIPSANTDRDERESYHTVKSTPISDLEQTKKHIDARYNEKIDDRKTIQINTSNIKALFEQKISDTNKALAQSTEHLAHLTEARQQQHKKIPISYASLKRNLPTNPQQQQPPNRRQSFQDSSNMNKYTDHSEGTKDLVIEDKQPERGHQTQLYTRRSNTDQLIRPNADSLTTSPATVANGYYSESLIAREIRETKEKEEELRQQRKKCGLPEDVSSLVTTPKTNSIKPDGSSQQVKNSSFLSNLDFFTSKANETNAPRRSTISIQNIVYDSHGTSSNDERKPIVSQELHRLNDNGLSVIRTNSANNSIQRSASNQNMISTNNIIQREIEAIRAKEAELRQSGRIQHTSDEHSDPRKYQEFVSSIPKSQSINALPTGKTRRDMERFNGPMTATSNGILKPKPMNNNSSVSSVRGRFPSPNPRAPIISSSNKTIDYSKLSSTDRLELEKRECQEREQELKKQRHSLTGVTLSVNSTINGDSGNASQDEHDDDQERYFDKIARIKRTENEKAQAPVIRPTKKLNLSQKWEQMVANKNNTPTGDDDDDDDKY